MAEALCLFRDGERRKLLVRGSNSTTRSYSVTGMEPCDPFSPGWTEALELYGSYNGLKTKGPNGDQSQFYGVRPKDNNVCPTFSERDLSLLDEAIPNLVSNCELTILDHAKTKCYSVVEEIINKWVERFGDGQPRSGRPRAVTDAEKVALEHMDIIQIISLVPKAKGSLLIDENYKSRKRDVMLTLTKPLEIIRVQPKNCSDNNKNDWFNATKLNEEEGLWSICDGSKEYKHLSTIELDDLYNIDLSYNMFPNDNQLKETTWRSNRRRRIEKQAVIKKNANKLAEEEQRSDLKELYDQFMKQPVGKRTFPDFERQLVQEIEKPSDHTVLGTLFCSSLANLIRYALLSLSLSLTHSLFLSHTNTHPFSSFLLPFSTIRI